MKALLLIVFTLTFFVCSSQQEKFAIQGRILDSNNNPVPDAYIINARDMDKNTSRPNGVFDAMVLPEDSLIITHVSFFRKTVTVYELLQNPIIQLDLDTINILQVDVLSDDITDLERAAKNMNEIDYDFRSQDTDTFTESERMEDLLNTENRVQRSAASSLTYEFSPSELIMGLVNKIKKRKKASGYSSTKKKKQEPR